MTRNLEAVLWVTAGTALFSLVFASGKFAGDSASALQILCLRYLGGLLTLLLLVKLRRQNLGRYRSKQPASHLLRAFFGAFGGAALIYASAEMPILEATAIGLRQAVFAVALGVVLLREAVEARQGLGTAACCAGAVVVVASKGAFGNLDWATLGPAAVALLGAFLVACEGFMIKKLATWERPLSILLYVNAFGFLLLGLPAALTWQATDLPANLPFLLLGPLAITAQYFIIRGYRLADLALLGPIDYSWLVFAGLLGFFFFGEAPGIGALLGCLLILLGGVVLASVRPQGP